MTDSTAVNDATATVKSERWVLSTDAYELLERFLIISASTFVGVRIFLALTGYPQIGGHGLHIAHLLWGGLLMMISLVVLFAFVGRDLRLIWVIGAGIGWGLFIDELGKFITSDVNYFYRPAVPLIYAIFVLLFIAFREIFRRAKSTPRGRVVEAMEILQTGIMRGLTEADRARLDTILAQSDTCLPVANMLRALLDDQTAIINKPSREVQLVARLSRAYLAVSQSRLFIALVILIAVGVASTQFVELLSEIVRTPAKVDGEFRLTWFSAVKGVSTFLSAGLVLLGAFQARKDRVIGLRLMQAGILVGLLIGQVLAFYTYQILALWGLVFHLVALGVVNYALEQETQQAAESHH